MAGPGSFGRQEDCSMRGVGGSGLNWFTAQEFGSYTLKLDWKLVKDDNSGIFVGFPNPGNDRNIAINQGYEIQVDESDVPDRLTGSIYTFKGADRAAVLSALKPWGQWNAYEIQVQGQNIKVLLNGVLVNDFTSVEPIRDLTQGFIGVQNHGAGELIWYRNIRLEPGAITPPPVEVEEEVELEGSVAPTLAVGLAGTTSLGSFVPSVARDYTANLTATVTSTAGAATLTVADASATQTGKLVNGTHALAQPLQVRSGTAAFAPLTAPAALLALTEPVSGEPVPVEFKQSIGERDPLRTGRYSKTLTFTLSTTTP
jgi:hypothetical protein